MVRTIVYVAHHDMWHSSSHRFLLNAGENVQHVDLTAECEAGGGHFDVEKERRRLLEYDCVIFQFQLIWYQAPAIMTQWIDEVFDYDATFQQFKQQLEGKKLGITVIAGVNANHYQVGERENVTISELLASYGAFARHMKMVFLPPLAVHQFQYMTEEEKYGLLWRYRYYLATGRIDTTRGFNRYLYQQLQHIVETSTGTDEIVYRAFMNEWDTQNDELDELYRLTEDWM